MSHSQHNTPPLMKELSEKLKEPFDTIKTLLTMEVLAEKPPLPTIVVLGEAGACAASVISTLVGFNVPSGLEIPLLLKFTNDSSPSRKILLEYLFECSHFEKEVHEALCVSEIEELVKQIPENKRSNIEVTLTVVQPHVSDLTVVLLPEVNTLPWLTPIEDMIIKERKENELFKGYIRRYKINSGCLFLNVLSCPSNFNSYRSRRILKELDYRFIMQTVTVFTKVDLSSEYMIEDLTSKNIIRAPFGYFFVDNIIEDGDEKTSEHVRLSEVIDKDYIGFDVISKHLVTAMLSIIFGEWSLIPQRIESYQKKCDAEMKKCQETFDSVSDAVPEILTIFLSANNCLHDLFITQDYREYRKVKCMHASSNIGQRFKRFRIDLQNLDLDYKIPFLQYEIELLSKSQHSLPFFDTSIFIKPLLSRQFSYASCTVDIFITSTIDYIREVVIQVLIDCAKNNIQLHKALKKAGRVLVEDVEKGFEKKVQEMLDLEKKCFNTFNDNYNTKLNEMTSLKLDLSDGKESTSIEGLGKNIRVDHLKRYSVEMIDRAFEMKKTLVVYWEFVVNRVVDYCSLYLQSSIKKMMDVGIPGFINVHLAKCVNDKSKLPDVEDILAIKKAKLEGRIEYLTKVKKDIEKWQVAVDGFDYWI